MSARIVAFVGTMKRPSRAQQLVAITCETLRRRSGLEAECFDLLDAGPGFANACERGPADPQTAALVRAIEGADGLIVGCPVHQGSFPGLFKHAFDLVDPTALRNTPVLLTAVGGGLRHALIIEHQLRPLFGFFEAATVSTGLYASAGELGADGILPAALEARIENAVGQFLALTAARSEGARTAADHAAADDGTAVDIEEYAS